MKLKIFRWIGIIVLIGIGAVIGWSIALKNFIIPVIAVVIGISIIYFLKKRVKEVIEDERIYKIANNASRSAFQVFVSIAATAGVVLIALREKNPEFAQTGLTLAFSACSLLVLYIVFYFYYSKYLK